MGQWNTLHLFDENKFYNKVVPAFKNDASFLKSYFNSNLGPFLLEDPDVLTDERIENIMAVANAMSEDFRNYSELIEIWQKPDYQKVLHSQKLEDFRALFFIIVFSEYALFYPYYKLGYRLMISYLEFKTKNGIAERKIDKIKYNRNIGGIFPEEIGIRNWIGNDEVSQILHYFHEVMPVLRSKDAPSHNKFATLFFSEFKQFLSIAKTHGFGLISCLDPDEYAFKSISPIGHHINWHDFKFEHFLIRKR